jgi:hypothetical protein
VNDFHPNFIPLILAVKARMTGGNTSLWPCHSHLVNKELLEQAPGFDKDNWPSPDNRQFALEVYKYYGRVPYWEQEEPRT